MQYIILIQYTYYNNKDDEGPISCTMEQMILMSIKVDNMYRFLADSEGQLQARTIVNYTAAFQWHLIFLRYLHHPDTETAANTPEQGIQKAVRGLSKTERDTHQREMKECMKKIKGMMTKSSVVAERQTILRNGKEALQMQGKWVSVDFMMTLKEAADTEGWARLKSLEARLQIVPLKDLIQVSVSFFTFEVLIK